jgi:hypothetical protein
MQDTSTSDGWQDTAFPAQDLLHLNQWQMDCFAPGWTHRHELLNSLPVTHVDWAY